jgi:hypothetical protein
LDLSQYISKWHEISLTYTIFYYLWNPKAVDLNTLKQRRHNQKTRSNTKSSKAHNFHKNVSFLLLKIWEYKHLIVFYNLSMFHSKRSRFRLKDLTSTTFDVLICSHLFSFLFFLFTFFPFPVSLLHLTNSYDFTINFLTLDLSQLSYQTT